METTHSYETSVNVYQTTRRHILDDSDLGSHSSENLRSNQSMRFQAVGCGDPVSIPVQFRWGLWHIDCQQDKFTSSSSVAQIGYPFALTPYSIWLICRRQRMVCLPTALPNKPQDITNIPRVMRSALFWDLTQRRFVIPYRRFGTTYRSHLQGTSPRNWDR